MSFDREVRGAQVGDFITNEVPKNTPQLLGFYYYGVFVISCMFYFAG